MHAGAATFEQGWRRHVGGDSAARARTRFASRTEAVVFEALCPLKQFPPNKKSHSFLRPNDRIRDPWIRGE